MITTSDLLPEADFIRRTLAASPFTRNMNLVRPDGAAGRCGLVSYALADALRKNGLGSDPHLIHCEGLYTREGWENWSDTWVRYAIPALDDRGAAEHKISHAMVDMGDGRVIDATARQFDRYCQEPVVVVRTLKEVTERWVTVWHVDMDYLPHSAGDRRGYYFHEDYLELQELLNT